MTIIPPPRVNELLKPAFSEKNIPIVFAADDNFVPFLSVAIESIVAHSSSGYGYDLIILEEKISENNKEHLKTQISKDNFSLRFYNIRPFFERYADSIFYVHRYYTKAIYYRLFVPEIFSSYQTVAYLDCDVVVCDDIAKIYDFILDDNLIAAVKDIPGFFSAQKRNKTGDWEEMTSEYHRHTLGLASALEYFYSGIMLFNIQKALNDDLLGKCLSTLERLKTPDCPDQDALVVACRGEVFNLPLRWNYVWDIPNYDFLKGHVPEAIFDEYAVARSDPKIIHYAGPNRPWTRPALWADHFWRHAVNTPYYKELREIFEQSLKACSHRILREMRWPWYLKMREFMYTLLLCCSWGKMKKRNFKRIASLETRKKIIDLLRQNPLE
jgi:lipopolysaccharide biosynthesis glycosyltransferase